MSRFFSSKYNSLEPYTPGEQPKDVQYVKLNTNESPFAPSPRAVEYAAKAAQSLQLYPDPECRELTQRIADYLGLDFDQVLVTNGSDEILNFAFMAFCDEDHPAVFPDISYGFYPVFAQLNGIPYTELPLRDDFTIDADEYCGIGKTIIIANPNAPTGIALSTDEIEKIVKSNPDSVVVVDEAYVDFGGESCIKLINKYDNLLVTQTFSKSRSMAGARLGFGAGSKELIRDLNTIKYSTNPYNINKMTMAAGLGVMEDEEYTQKNCRTIIENREWTEEQLRSLGFETTVSKTNFVFAKHSEISGEKIYTYLKENGVLVRHFSKERICEYNRITVGTREQMEIFIDKIKLLLEEN
ncbi:MAG: histidinol-phosphate transaminase [Clostridia bacterium]|nr:histidinol-phosphate transaminase [Clostridia bacterium]